MIELFNFVIPVYVLACGIGALALVGGALVKIGAWLYHFDRGNPEHVNHLVGTLFFIAFTLGVILYASAS